VLLFPYASNAQIAGGFTVEIGRLLTAMATPFDENGRVDFAQAKRLANALLDSGSDGMVVAGTTGEAPTLTHEEKLQLFAEIKQEVGGRGTVLAGTGTYSTAKSIDLTREAAAAGVDGVLLTCPYYNRPPQEGLFRHFEAIASSTTLPCILYNVQSRTGVNMTAETTARLSHVPNIIGTKEASGDLEQIAEIVAHTSPDFKVWSGDDSLTLPILSVGGYGAISVVSHLAGLQIRSMIEAYIEGRPAQAAEIHQNLLPLINAIMGTMANPMPLKHALNDVGFYVGNPRLPLMAPEGAIAEAISEELRRHRIDLPVAV
jgi:4-hydroxy-tetrahydrodipicolinate synthase